MLGTDDGALDEVPLAVLEREIAGFAGRLAAATATWLIWIGAFDRRQGWQRWEQTSCAGWLNWKCGVDLRTGREHVRVARALEGLPIVRRLFLAGELSYSKVRAITRVADRFNEAELCDLALEATASQMEGTCRGMRERGPLPVWAPTARFEAMGDHGRMMLELPIDDFRRVREIAQGAVDRLVGEVRADSGDEVTRHDVIESLGGMGAVLSAVIAGLITGSLDGPEGPFEDMILVADVEALRSHGGAEATSVDGQCDAEAPVETVDSRGSDAAEPAEETASPKPATHETACCGGSAEPSECTLAGEWLPPIVARRVACDARLQAALENAVGDAVGLGRESRVVNRRLRRLLMRRDGGMCRFPGCGMRRGLHAHHVVHWADGGETEMENLVMVCGFHHRSLHEGGWNVVNKAGRFVFYDPTGRASHVERMADPAPGRPLPERSPHVRNGSAEPLAGRGERMDMGYVVSTLLANAELRRNRAAAQAALSQA